MEQTKDFIGQLRKELTEQKRKRAYLSEHKFEKEAQFIRERIAVIEEILDKLEMVADGAAKGNEISFTF